MIVVFSLCVNISTSISLELGKQSPRCILPKKYNLVYYGGRGGDLGKDGAVYFITAGQTSTTGTGTGGVAGQAVALTGFTATITGNTPLGTVS